MSEFKEQIYHLNTSLLDLCYKKPARQRLSKRNTNTVEWIKTGGYLLAINCHMFN